MTDPEIHPLDDVAHACGECGVAVWDVDLHLEWHRDIKPWLTRLIDRVAHLWNSPFTHT